MSEETAADRLHDVQERVARVLQHIGRPADSARLIAVSKTFDAAAIEPVIAAGQREFGENRVQEAMGKWPALRQRHADIRLHLIGPLQSNKAREAVELFDAIHTIDRPKIAEAVGAEMRRLGKPLDLFVQVNTGEEPQKAGVVLAEVDGFVARCREEWQLPIKGLMCIPPIEQPPSPHFALLAKMAARNGLPWLSMGMSGDFEQALMVGSTHVRVGSAIFGHR